MYLDFWLSHYLWPLSTLILDYSIFLIRNGLVINDDGSDTILKFITYDLDNII